MYFNSRTWVALINLTQQQLSSSVEFQSLFTALEQSRTIAQLEQHPGLVQRKPAVVSITQKDGLVMAHLQRVALSTNGALVLSEVPDEPEGS
jgi:hypothetical protein